MKDRHALSRLRARLLWALFCLGLATHTLCVAVGERADATASAYHNPVRAGNFPDPSVIRVGSEYWAVTTASPRNPLFPLLHSRDLVHWEIRGQVFPKTPTWAKSHFWAPEIAEDRGRFFIYYTARQHDGRLAVAVATAPQPSGPWTDHGVLVAQEDGSIDAVPFTDAQGMRWLLWKEDGNSRRHPTRIWIQPLRDDGLALVGERHEILRNDTPWEGAVVEGPFVLRRGEFYYLFYSGAGCCGKNCDYALGVARAKSILGPWEKFPGNPILAGNATWRCPGHGSIVADPAGRYWLLYHAYRKENMPATGRQMLLDEVVFGADGWPSINQGQGPSTQANAPALAAPASSTVDAPATAPKPNIVIVLADDLGRADLGYQGSDIRTPNLDRLAATGVRFDRFYACPVCSPTRAGLLTGRWPIRQGIMRTVIPPWSKHGLPLNETTLADALGTAGYARRGIFGKWHLGHAQRAYLPPQRGFTHFYGHYNGAIDYFTHEREGETDWHRDAETVKEPGYSTDLLAREAVRFIDESPVGSPFFLYLPFNAPHAPYQAKPEELARYPQRTGERRTYAAMIDNMDQSIGRVLTAIEQRADAANTFVLFFSDNGGHLPVASNAPLRDGKFSVYEGGIRVAALARWPAGGLAGGRVCAELTGYIDVLPTVLAIAGANSAVGALPLDGRDMLAVWRGTARAPERPWFSFIAPQTTETAAVTLGPWKLVVSGPRVLSASPDAASKVELFHLEEDPQETRNRAAEEPARVAQLRALLTEFGTWQLPGVGAFGDGRRNFRAPKDWVIKD